MPVSSELEPVSLQERKWTQQEQWTLGLAILAPMGIEPEGVGSHEKRVLRAEIMPFFTPLPTGEEECREAIRRRTQLLQALVTGEAGIICLYGADVNQGKLDILGYSMVKWAGNLEEGPETTRAGRQAQSGSPIARLRMEKLDSATRLYGATPEAARVNGKKTELVLRMQLDRPGANFDLFFDEETGVCKLVLPPEKWSTLGLTLKDTGYCFVGCEFRPVVGGVRGMEVSEKAHGDIWFLGVR